MRDVASGPEYVVEENGRIIATGTLMVERKFARSCGVVGHIEDIAVLTSAQGQGLGKVIIRAHARRGADGVKGDLTARRRTSRFTRSAA